MSWVSAELYPNSGWSVTPLRKRKMSIKNEEKKHSLQIFCVENFADSCFMVLYDVIITTCWLKKKKTVNQTTNVTCWPIWVEPLDFSYQLHCILKIRFRPREISFLPFFPRHKAYQEKPTDGPSQQSSHEMSPSQTMTFIISPSTQLSAGGWTFPSLRFTSFNVFCSLWCCCNKKAVRRFTWWKYVAFKDANDVKVNFKPIKMQKPGSGSETWLKTCVYFFFLHIPKEWQSRYPKRDKWW